MQILNLTLNYFSCQRKNLPPGKFYGVKSVGTQPRLKVRYFHQKLECMHYFMLKVIQFQGPIDNIWFQAVLLKLLTFAFFIVANLRPFIEVLLLRPVRTLLPIACLSFWWNIANSDEKLQILALSSHSVCCPSVRPSSSVTPKPYLHYMTI